jgi:hypothetical protein
MVMGEEGSLRCQSFRWGGWGQAGRYKKEEDVMLGELRELRTGRGRKSKGVCAECLVQKYRSKQASTAE